MRLRIIVSSQWTVAAVVDARGRCPVEEALDAMRQTDKVARAQITAMLERASHEGPQLDPRRSRPLGGGIFELKVPTGWRLLYFYDRGRLIVCSQLRRKPKPNELRAIRLRAQGERAGYFTARARGALVMEDPWQD